jgi:sugar transferase (PEP-CTERM system associated)
MIRFFRHYVPASILLLVITEALILGSAIFLGAGIRFSGQALSLDYTYPLLPAALSFTAIMIILMSAFGLYNFEWKWGVKNLLLRLGLAFGVGLMIMVQLFYFIPSISLDRGVFLLGFGVSLAGIILARLGYLKWANLDTLKSRVLVLGTGSRAAKVEDILSKRGPSCGIQVVGYFPANGTHHFIPHDRIIPDDKPLSELIDRYQVNEILLAVRERRSGGLPISELLDCKLRGVRITELSTFFERENGHLQLDSMNASWMILGEGFHQGLLRDTVKRVFDLLVSLTLLTVTSPIMLITAILIKLESHGPVFYRQERIGQHGRPFSIFKFRSMRADAEKDGRPQWARKNDDRITLIGRFIRRTRIDELPQVFNVFMGEMSFVGPRPERPYFVADLNRKIPYYGVRHIVKPGITGWAQVRYPYGASVEDSLEKLQYDLYYVKNHSLFLDLMILTQTVQVVLWGQGAR